MKKLLLGLTLLLISNQLVLGQDFRNTTWGMSKQEVKGLESLKGLKVAEQDINNVYYETKIDNKESILIYRFNDNKLTMSAYVFDVKHSNQNLFISDYEKIQTLLIEKYGKPSVNRIDWNNTLFKGNKENWGLAVGMGYVEYITMWELEKTTIILNLNGDNYKINHMLIYQDKAFANNQKQNTDDL